MESIIQDTKRVKLDSDDLHPDLLNDLSEVTLTSPTRGSCNTDDVTPKYAKGKRLSKKTLKFDVVVERPQEAFIKMHRFNQMVSCLQILLS